MPIPVNAFLNHVFGGFSITPYEIIKVQKRVSEDLRKPVLSRSRFCRRKDVGVGESSNPARLSNTDAPRHSTVTETMIQYGTCNH